jgi:hypothetical protein
MRKSILCLITVLLTGLPALVSPLPSLAECAVGSTDIGSCFSSGISDANDGDSQIDLSGGLGFSTVPQAVETVITILFVGSALLVFGYLLYGGITYITAGDDSSRTNRGRQLMINALIGLVLLALVYVVWLLIINLIPGVSSFFGNANSDAPNCTNQGETIC